MKVKVAVVGIGQQGKGIVQVIQKNPNMEVVAICDLKDEAIKSVENIINKDTLITKTSEDVLNVNPDILIDSTPAIIESAILIKKALSKKINVILMNSEVDQMYGRYLANEAEKNGVILTSDSGDQYGVLARLIDDINLMGLEVVLAGNNKGFLNRYATPSTLVEEAAKRRLTLNQCTQYTDGTKLAIEMALIGNYLNFTVLEPGMTGPKVDHVNDALNNYDLDRARKLGGVVDYVLGAKPGGSVFAIAYSENPDDQFYLNYYKMGDGPYYLFMKPYHLCHFETPHTINKIMRQKEPVMIQTKRTLEVITRAKTDLKTGTVLDGIGGYHVYGTLERPGYLPIGLSEGVKLLANKRKDEIINWNDVEFPLEDERLLLWEEQLKIEKR